MGGLPSPQAPAELHVAALKAMLREPSRAAREAATIVAYCEHPEEEVAEAAVAILESMGLPDRRQVSQLITVLQHPEGDAAYWAATLVGRLGAAEPAAIHALAAATRSNAQLAVRERAAWALGQLDAVNPAARTALEEAAASPSPRLARIARESLRKLGLPS